MEDSVIVACHAPALSLLLYETARSAHDQRGLLIGEVFNEVISKKTDDNEINKEHKTVIYIKHCMPILNRELLGNVGDINAQECLKLTEPKKVVGWYSFRRNTRVMPNTLGEMLIHKALLEVIPGCKPEFFVAAFMTSNIVQSYSTHSYQHIFTRYNQIRDKFEPLKLKIYSLSDKSVNSSSKTSFPLSLRFHKIVGSFQKEENPVKSVLAVHDKVSELLSTFSSKLQEQENKRSELESEIKQLKKQLGLDSTQDVIVEEEPELEEFPKEKFIYFNPDKKYNSSRTSNPIKVSNVSPVPDDDEDDNEDVEILDEEDQKKPTAIASPASLRSYASVLDRNNSSPAFNVKTPRLRPGLSPNFNAKKTPVPKKEVENIENQDIFESAEEMDENSEKITTVNSQSSNQMETEQ